MLEELVKSLTFLFLVVDHREGEAFLGAVAGTCQLRTAWTGAPQRNGTSFTFGLGHGEGPGWVLGFGSRHCVTCLESIQSCSGWRFPVVS